MARRNHTEIGTEDILRAFFSVPGGEKTQASSFMMRGGFAREVFSGMFEYSENVRDPLPSLVTPSPLLSFLLLLSPSSPHHLPLSKQGIANVLIRWQMQRVLEAAQREAILQGIGCVWGAGECGWQILT